MNKSFKASVVEVFDSLQGEGRYIGARQIFVRLSGCPLSCDYCDTDHSARPSVTIGKAMLTNPVSAADLAAALSENFILQHYHSVSFTGGEPLLYIDFLKEISPLLRPSVPLFLETSGHDPLLLTDIADYFDYISVDLKGHIQPFASHADRLLSAVGLIEQSKVYVKIPLSANDDDVVAVSAPIFDKYAVWQVWLQPLDNIYNMEQVLRWIASFADNGVKARFIPQMHKLMDIP